MNLISIFLMMQQQEGGKGGGMSTLIMLGLIIVIFYFFMIRPQVKRGKEQRKFMENLERGQKVITSGGIHGKIVDMQDNTVIIETEGNGRLRVEKSAIIYDASANKTEQKN